MCSFQCLFYQPVFYKKQLLCLRWLLASLLWHLTEDLNLLGLFDRNVGLTTMCHGESFRECHRRWSTVTNSRGYDQQKKQNTSRVCQQKQQKVDMSDQPSRNSPQSCKQGFQLMPFIQPYPIASHWDPTSRVETYFEFFEYQFFEIWIASSFMLWTCFAPHSRLT